MKYEGLESVSVIDITNETFRAVEVQYLINMAKERELFVLLFNYYNSKFMSKFVQ